jgi:hypothetical protein
LPETARRVGLEPGPAFDALADAIADTAARNLPIVAASAGFTYRYNPQLEVFERTSETLGPIFMERPDTLGRGKMNVAVTFQYVELDEIDGVDTDHLQNADPLVARETDADGNLTGFTANDLRYNFKLINHIVGFSFTYGILDDLDINILVPLISTDYDVTANRLVTATAGPDGVFSPTGNVFPVSAGLDATKVGIGDILLRAKYQLPRCAWLRSAAGLQLRLPSGDEDNFQGTGDTEVSPFLYASTVLWGRMEPHANVGLDLRTDDVEQSFFRWGLGVDVDITKRIGAAVGFLGRSEWNRSSPPGETSFLHLTPTGVRQEPLLGINFDRKDLIDFTFGGRAVVWRQLMVFANGIYALNNAGLRSSSVIPMIGLEGTF